MKTWRAWMMAIATALTASGALAQPSSPRPAASAATLLHEAVEVLSTRALGHERVDWKSLEAELAKSLKDSDPPAAAYSAIAAAVARLADPHARFVPATPPAQPQPEPPPAKAAPTSEDPKLAPAPPPRPPIPTKPEGKILDGSVAYLIVPGSSAQDVPRYALDTAAELKRLFAESPRAWIIDLRLNGGGNLWPMLLGLRPLLGDGPLMTMTNGDKTESHFGVGPDGAWIDWGRGHEMQLDWSEGNPPPPIPRFKGRIAILLGAWTMSSGEALAICFAGREDTRTFGEKTAGLTTVTNTFPLSDGSVLNLPVSRMGDRHGKPVIGSIEPAQPVPFGDWPRSDDAATAAAKVWLLERP